jgi:hypothetical protein
MAMPTNRWVDRTQPQTLMMATVLMYINAAFGVIDGQVLAFPIGTVLVAGPVAAGWGIANEKKWGYWLGLALAVLEVGFILVYFSAGALLNLIFYGALVALLLHPHSRSYRRTWFR